MEDGGRDREGNAYSRVTTRLSFVHLLDDRETKLIIGELNELIAEEKRTNWRQRSLIEDLEQRGKEKTEKPRPTHEVCRYHD